jgi:hypothetical protein
MTRVVKLLIITYTAEECETIQPSIEAWTQANDDGVDSINIIGINEFIGDVVE